MEKVNKLFLFFLKTIFISTFNRKDERKYIGYLKNNKMDGEWIFTWPDNRRYIGEYENYKKHGIGIFEL